MADLTWRDAILRILRSANEPMHYTAIAEGIAEQDLRADLGVNPATSVAATIAAQLQREVVRVTRGYYALAPAVGGVTGMRETPVEPDADDTGLINAFGMYWARPGPAFLASSVSSNRAAVRSTSPVSEASTSCTTGVRSSMSGG